MLKHRLHFKFYLILLVAGFILESAALASDLEPAIKKNKSGFWREFFDHGVYDEGTNFLHLDRLHRAITKTKKRAQDINIYDEVPDGSFFVNRHSRKKLTPAELEKGYQEGGGPDLSQGLTILKVHFVGLFPEFFVVKDAKGDKYTLKFDPPDHIEMATGSEVAGSRFYYAIGYHVPQYTMVLFEPGQLKLDPNAIIIDQTGFQKRLTQIKLDEALLFLGKNDEGKYRASAQKYIAGQRKGNFFFEGKQKGDPLDLIPHEERREIRALRVFASWIGNSEFCETTTQETLVEENGQKIVKHYLIMFNSSFGSAATRAKWPMDTFEHLLDYGETTKALLALGWYEKPWQRRQADEKKQVTLSQAMGNFDNLYFKPNRFKTDLPYFAFKDLTNADGFWAAKIIMSFSDEDLAAALKAGQFSSPEDVAYLTDILSKRRDIVGRYWFGKAAPLDRFDLNGTDLTFDDLAIQYGFASKNDAKYKIDVLQQDGKKLNSIGSLNSSSSSVNLDKWIGRLDHFYVKISPMRADLQKNIPYVMIELNKSGIINISHED